MVWEVPCLVAAVQPSVANVPTSPTKSAPTFAVKGEYASLSGQSSDLYLLISSLGKAASFLRYPSFRYEIVASSCFLAPEAVTCDKHVEYVDIGRVTKGAKWLKCVIVLLQYRGSSHNVENTRISMKVITLGLLAVLLFLGS